MPVQRATVNEMQYLLLFEPLKLDNGRELRVYVIDGADYHEYKGDRGKVGSVCVTNRNWPACKTILTSSQSYMILK